MGEKNSLFQEFLESWNEYMPEIPITESELRKPTELLFRHWLIQILIQLHVDTSCYENMNSEIGSRLRGLRIKLMSTVNYFLSIPACQKNMDLNYLNMINPTFKIVFVRLRYLLNYSFFVNMIYSNNIVDCAKVIEGCDELRSTKNQLLKDIEEAKIVEENYVKVCRDIEKRIPQQKSIISTLQEKEERLKKEFQNIEQDIEKMDILIIELNSQKTTMSENIVHDEEAESIYASLELTRRQLNEQEDFILAGRQKLTENSATVGKIRSLTDKMETLVSEFSLDTADVKSLKKNLVNLESSLKSLKSNTSRLNAEMEYLTQEIKRKKENIAKLNRNRNEIESSVGSKDKETMQALKQQVSALHKLSIKEDEMLIMKQRIKDEFELLYKISTNVFKQMSTSLYNR